MQSLMEELSEKARALSPEDRARLAEDLLQSLDDEPASEVEAAWDAEIEDRVAQIKAGTATLASAADVHAEARRIYR